jgi:hypothetical protein
MGSMGSRPGERTTRRPGLVGLKSMVLPNVHASISVGPSVRGAVSEICLGTSERVKVSRIEASRSSAGTSRVSSSNANGVSLFGFFEILFREVFQRL